MTEGPTFVAIDIETRGDSGRKNGIVSVGLAKMPANGTGVIKLRFDLAPLPGQHFEQRCLDEFWHKNEAMRALLAKLTAQPLPALEGIAAFRAAIDAIPDPIFLSDNPAFDFGIINYYLDLADLPSLRYDATRTKYRSVYDTNGYARGAARLTYATRGTNDAAIAKQLGAVDAPNEELMHNHDPADDAEYILLHHLAIVKASTK